MKREPQLCRVVMVAVALLALTGCAETGNDDLRAWMKDQEQQIKPRVEPLSEPKPFSPKTYDQEGAAEPFNNQKLTQALRRDATEATANAALIAPELNRRKEPLEAFPLDSMRMVGSLIRDKSPVALVKVDALLYQVRVGQYLGQNYGRVTKVDETSVELREIVQDAAGEWIERKATLQLQEVSK